MRVRRRQRGGKYGGHVPGGRDRRRGGPGRRVGAGRRKPLIGAPVAAVGGQQVGPRDHGERRGRGGWEHRHSLAYGAPGAPAIGRETARWVWGVAPEGITAERLTNGRGRRRA